MMTQYRGIPLGELSPHAYAIAEQVLPGPSILSLPNQSCAMWLTSVRMYCPVLPKCPVQLLIGTAKRCEMTLHSHGAGVQCYDD